MPAILKLIWPYLIAAAIGFSAAFGLQELRITAAKQDFTEYKQKQIAAAIEAKEAADKQREKASADYAKLSGILDNEINSGVVYRRCVDAGRCGVRKQSCPVQAVTVPPSVRPDESSADSIPVGQEPAEKLADECAETTLLLNQLQISISSQPGY